MTRLLTLGALLLLGSAGTGPAAVPVGPAPTLEPEMYCTIYFSYDHTADQDVWFRWGESTFTREGEVLGFLHDVFDRTYIGDEDENRREPAGDQLRWANGFTFNGSCDTRRSFSVRVSFGSIELPIGGWTPEPAPFVEIRRVSGDGQDYEPVPGASGRDLIIIPLGESACWLKAQQEGTFIRSGDPATGCAVPDEEEEEVDPLRIQNFRSGPVCDEGSGDVGRPPSSRICEGTDIPIRGLETCVFNEARMPCTWWGFEFEYQNARPGVPLTCVWTRSRPGTEGNWEGVRSRGIATDSIHIDLGGTAGHTFFPAFDVYTDDIAWPVVDVEFTCSYGGHRAFSATHRLLFSSQARR